MSMIIYLISSFAILFSIFYFALIQWLLTQWKAIDIGAIDPAASVSTPVTVVVPARNEAEHIKACLDSLLQQVYPAELLEIVVIDDHSTDATPQLVQTYPTTRIRLLSLANHLPEPTQSYKKAALTAGVAHAHGSLIVTTDADCIAPPHWIRHIVQVHEQKGWQCIAGPVLFHQEQNALEKFQSLDFLGTMVITGAGVHSGQLLLANGANFAYTKAAFEAVDGFAGVTQNASGDDLFLLHKIAQHYPNQIGFLKQREATILTQAMPNLRSFFQQRIRWGTKNTSYSDIRVTWIAGLVFFTCWSILGTALLGLLAFPSLLITFLLALGIKAWADFVLLRTAMRFFQREDLRGAVGWAQLGHVLYIAFVGVASLMVRRYVWKGRQVE